MSRLGKAPIFLPKGVEIKKSEQQVEVKGPKGVLHHSLPQGILFEVHESQLIVKYDEESGLPKPMYGLYRSLLSNAIVGVSEGFKKELNLIGVGYRAAVNRAAVKGDILDIQIGFSHPYQLKVPDGVQVTVAKNTAITITGIDKQVVGQFAANIRALRPPEPYKGKGIRYVDEYVRRKAGKSTKGK